MTDYVQPDFYRFNEDSLLLVQAIVGSGLRPSSILDIGAGSGIIGIELAVKLHIPVVHLIELQREWNPFLSENIQLFIPERETKVYWESVAEWKPQRKYDLVVSNPPYYLPGKGKLSPDSVRAHCRTFLKDSWKLLLQKASAALSSGGEVWFVTLAENLSYVMNEAEGLHVTYEKHREIVILKISLSE